MEHMWLVYTMIIVIHKLHIEICIYIKKISKSILVNVRIGQGLMLLSTVVGNTI